MCLSCPEVRLKSKKTVQAIIRHAEAHLKTRAQRELHPEDDVGEDRHQFRVRSPGKTELFVRDFIAYFQPTLIYFVMAMREPRQAANDPMGKDRILRITVARLVESIRAHARNS